jgi:hypothetical protein
MDDILLRRKNVILAPSDPPGCLSCGGPEPCGAVGAAMASHDLTLRRGPSALAEALRQAADELTLAGQEQEDHRNRGHGEGCEEDRPIG